MGKHRVVVGALLAVAVVTSSPPADAREVVSIQLRGHYYSEPATVRITVAVEPDEANRTLLIEADGDSMFRSTEVNLEGKAEKRLHTIEFKNLPAGGYQLRARVLSSTSVRGSAKQELVVTGLGAQ